MLDDNTVMKGTAMSPTDDGKIILQYTLPSGLVIDSQPLEQGTVKGSLLVNWCEHVRTVEKQQGEAKDEENAEKKRRRQAGETAPTVEAAPEVPTSSTPADPEDFATSNRDAARKQVEALSTQSTDIAVALEFAILNRDKWEATCKTLGETDEDTDTDSPS